MRGSERVLVLREAKLQEKSEGEMIRSEVVCVWRDPLGDAGTSHRHRNRWGQLQESYRLGLYFPAAEAGTSTSSTTLLCVVRLSK